MGTSLISARFNELGKNGSHVRLGIMGGTFDPIHTGHLLCAEEARLTCELDAVLFIPTGIPNFKQDHIIAPAQNRLEMCHIACDTNPHFDVSDIEIAREGITYTVDTLQLLREHYPENVEFYFIMGTDSYLSLPQWRKSNQIVELVHFIVVSRPGYMLDEAEATLKAAFAERGYDNINIYVESIEAPALEVSSSDLRKRISQGKTLRYLTPHEVAIYIRENKLYRENQDAATRLNDSAELPSQNQDALSDEFYAARAKEVVLRVSEKRAKHIEGVAQAAAMLARTYGVDERKAHLAGLLHDWDKGYNNEEIRARIIELGMVDDVDPWVVEHMPQVMHGPTAAVALKRDFPTIPDDVIQAIDRHTTTARNMSDLDKILYVADAIEESRQFGKIDDLRALVGNVSLDELFFSTYEYWTLLLFERKKLLHPDTTALWNDHILHQSKKEGK